MKPTTRRSESEAARNVLSRAASETAALTTVAGGMVLASLQAAEANRAEAAALAKEDAAPPGGDAIDTGEAAAAAARPSAAEATVAPAPASATEPSPAPAGQVVIAQNVGEDARPQDQAQTAEPASTPASADTGAQARASSEGAQAAETGSGSPSQLAGAVEGGPDLSPSSAAAMPSIDAAQDWDAELERIIDEFSAPIIDFAPGIAATSDLAARIVTETAGIAGAVVDDVLSKAPSAGDLIASIPIAGPSFDALPGSSGGISQTVDATLGTPGIGDGAAIPAAPAAAVLVGETLNSLGLAGDGGSSAVPQPDALVETVTGPSPGIANLATLPMEILGGTHDDEAALWGAPADVAEPIVMPFGDPASSIAGSAIDGGIVDLGFLGQSYIDDAGAHDPGGLAMSPGLSGLI